MQYDHAELKQTATISAPVLDLMDVKKSELEEVLVNIKTVFYQVKFTYSQNADLPMLGKPSQKHWAYSAWVAMKGKGQGKSKTQSSRSLRLSSR